MKKLKFFIWKMEGKNVIKKVEVLQAMEALIITEADTMSALKFPMGETALLDGHEILQEQRNCRREEAHKIQRSVANVRSSLMWTLEWEQFNAFCSTRVDEEELGHQEFKNLGWAWNGSERTKSEKRDKDLLKEVERTLNIWS